MSAQGYLTVHAFTSSALIPIAGVTVAVTQRQSDGSAELLALRLTDESGRIEPIAIGTPPLSASQSPSEERPFAVVDLTADHPWFERIEAEGVQIFPDTTTDQALQLIPLEQAPEIWDRTEVFETPAQDL